jgi:hypothetical protein
LRAIEPKPCVAASQRAVARLHQTQGGVVSARHKDPTPRAVVYTCCGKRLVERLSAAT